jgi:hypothetical protein
MNGPNYTIDDLVFYSGLLAGFILVFWLSGSLELNAVVRVVGGAVVGAGLGWCALKVFKRLRTGNVTGSVATGRPSGPQTSTVEVWMPDGQVRTYASISDLQSDLACGELHKRYRARVKILDSTSDSAAFSGWATIGDIARSESCLQKILRPINYYMRQSIPYGILAGIGVKAIDTAILFLGLDTKAGMMWLALMVSLATIKWFRFYPIVAYLGLCFLLKFPMQGFLPTLSIVAVIGSMFGVPAGVLVGTMIGHIKSRKLSQLVDVDDEGIRPYFIGIIIPGAFLATALPFYIFWLTPQLAEWLA